MSKAAPPDLMQQLHALLAGSMKSDLENYILSGEPVPPQLYSNIIKFLKDNGIESTEAVTDLKASVPKLPFASDAELRH